MTFLISCKNTLKLRYHKVLLALGHILVQCMTMKSAREEVTVPEIRIPNYDLPFHVIL